MALQLFRLLFPNHPGPIVVDIDSSKLKIALKRGAKQVINMKSDEKTLNSYANSIV